MSSAPPKGLERRVSLPAAAALVVGATVGVGIFLTPAGMARSLASPGLVFAVWLFMGVAALCGALSFGELAARYPEAGGSYVYLREAHGPAVAFLYGWKCLLVMDPGLTAALAVGLGAYAAAALPGLPPKAVALGAIAAVAAANVLGVRLASAIGHGLALAKIALLLGLVAWGFASGAGELSHFTPFLGRRADAPPLVPALAGALVLAFFSFGGWWEAAKLAGEVKDPRRVLPRALALGVGAVTLLYAAVSAVFLYLVPTGREGSPETFATEAGVALFGPGGGRALSALVALFVLGSLFAFMTFAPRLYYAMARDGAAPAFVGRVDPRTGVPVRAIAVQAALAAALVALGTFETIVAYFVFATVAFLALTVAGLYRLPPPEAAFRVPGWPLTPLVFLAMLALMLALLGAGSPRQAALGVAVVAAGIPVYRLVVAPRHKVRSGPIPLEEA
ncbi:MAG TPA: amino acid permease [Vicinamibacteria bacterium]